MIERTAAAYFSSVARKTPSCDSKIGKKIEYIVAELEDAVTDLGFKRKSRCIWRETGCGIERCFQTIELQGWKWNEASEGKFAVNLSIKFPEVLTLETEMTGDPWLGEIANDPMKAANLDIRLNEILPANREDWWTPEMDSKRDLWFEIKETTDLSALSEILRKSFFEYVSPWFERASNLEFLFSSTDRKPTSVTSRLCAGVLLNREDQVVRLFSESGSTRLSEWRFEAAKKWLQSRGHSLESVTWSPPEHHIAMHESEEKRKDERAAKLKAALEAALARNTAAANGDFSSASDIAEMLHSHMEVCCLAGYNSDPRLFPTAERMLASDAATRKTLVSAILNELATAPISAAASVEALRLVGIYPYDHVWGELLVALLKQLPCDLEFAESILSQLVVLARRVHIPSTICHGFPYPFPAIVSYLEKNAAPWSEDLKPQVRALLEELSKVVVEEDIKAVLQLEEFHRKSGTPTIPLPPPEELEAARVRIGEHPEHYFEKAERDAITALRKWMKRTADGSIPLEIEPDHWGMELENARSLFPGSPSMMTRFLEFLAHGVPPKLTKASSKALMEWLDNLAEESDREAIASWLDATLKSFIHTDLSYEWAMTRPRPGVGAIPGETSGNILLGLIRLARLWNAERFASALETVADASYRRIPDIGPRFRKSGNAAIEALGETPVGLAILRQMRANSNQASMIKQLDSVLK